MILELNGYAYRFWLFGIPVSPDFFGRFGTWFPRFARDVTWAPLW